MKKSRSRDHEDREEPRNRESEEDEKSGGNREKEPMKSRGNPRKTPIAPELTPCGWYLFLTKIIKGNLKKRRKSVKNAHLHQRLTKTLRMAKIGPKSGKIDRFPEIEKNREIGRKSRRKRDPEEIEIPRS